MCKTEAVDIHSFQTIDLQNWIYKAADQWNLISNY